MLDTHARRYIQPIVQKSAQGLIKMGITANYVTCVSLIVGVAAASFALAGYFFVAVCVLWLSGFLDVVDGTMARLTKATPFGTVLDVTFDRIVEITMILALAYRFPEALWAFLLLSVAIIVSMTVFLTVGAVTEKTGMKSFYYQAGLAERTEGFILFSVMLLWNSYITIIAMLFCAIVVITAFQRLWEAKKILN